MMRLDVAIVAEDRDGFIAALRELALDIENRKEESNCFIEAGAYSSDYSFTDCDDVHEDNAKAIVTSLHSGKFRSKS